MRQTTPPSGVPQPFICFPRSPFSLSLLSLSFSEEQVNWKGTLLFCSSLKQQIQNQIEERTVNSKWAAYIYWSRTYKCNIIVYFSHALSSQQVKQKWKFICWYYSQQFPKKWHSFTYLQQTTLWLSHWLSLALSLALSGSLWLPAPMVRWYNF